MEYLLPILILIVAFLFSSIGHGGASAYLALMAIFGISTIYMKASALTLNLFVAGISFYLYQRNGYFKWNVLFPFILGSIPLAFLGAKINLDPDLYKLILGILLIIAVLRIVVKPHEPKSTNPPHFLLGLIIGMMLGFFSGMIGIGGGIILTPILILFNWAKIKTAAAVSALFILLNSASGLAGIITTGINLEPRIYLWIIMGILGGLAGSYSGSMKFSTKTLKYILAAAMFLASIKLLVF